MSTYPVFVSVGFTIVYKYNLYLPTRRLYLRAVLFLDTTTIYTMLMFDQYIFHKIAVIHSACQVTFYIFDPPAFISVIHADCEDHAEVPEADVLWSDRHRPCNWNPVSGLHLRRPLEGLSHLLCPSLSAGELSASLSPSSCDGPRKRP